MLRKALMRRCEGRRSRHEELVHNIHNIVKYKYANTHKRFLTHTLSQFHNIVKYKYAKTHKRFLTHSHNLTNKQTRKNLILHTQTHTQTHSLSHTHIFSLSHIHTHL